MGSTSLVVFLSVFAATSVLGQVITRSRDKPIPTPLRYDLPRQFPFREYPGHYIGHDQSRQDLNAFSCQDRCDTVGLNRKMPCQCNKQCREHNDCCPDYREECLSCDGRCDFKFDKNFPCQCNRRCGKFGNCCGDHGEVCDNGNSSKNPDFGDPANVTDAQLTTLTEALWRAEETNNVANLIRVNLQNRTTFASTVDRATNPLLEVDPAAYRKPTIAKILPLHNNYDHSVRVAEVVTAQESTEETEFLDAILATPIMQKTGEFLIDKGLIVTQRRQNGRLRMNNRAFRDALHQIWFELYSREQNILGSSGFEHIFLGETKNGLVSGFHNWVFFSKEESKNNVNYYGHLWNLRLGPKGSIVKHKFRWNGSQKPVSTMFVGTSPELEMALYTICFYVRPGTRCPVSLNGKTFNIQTHYFTKQGKRFVASAYPDI